MKMKKRGVAILLGMTLCISTAFTALPAYGAETAGTAGTAGSADSGESTAPTVNDKGAIIGQIQSEYNETTKRNELYYTLNEEDMEFQIRQEGEYHFGGLRWSIWGSTEASYTAISVGKKLMKMAYQQTDVPLEIETVLGNYSISNDLMRYLVKKAKGSDVQLILEKVRLSESQKKIYGEDAYACKAYFVSGGKKITALGSETVELTLSVRDGKVGGFEAGRIDSNGKLHSIKSQSGGQIGNYKYKFNTKYMGTFVVASNARIEYAKRVTAVTASKVDIKAQAQKGAIKITWKKPSGLQAKGYQVYASGKKSGTYKRIRTTSKLYCTDSGLKSGTKRYYKVRAYAMVNGVKFYGKWSAIKTATAK